jgi:pheromone shutdown protein TraB
MLAVALVVGAGGYACIQGFLSSTTTTVKLATLEQLNREADPGRIFTPAAIALAVIAVFLVASAARAASPRSYSIDIE